MALTGRRVILLVLLAAALIAIALLPPSPDWWEARYRRWADTPTRLELINRTVRRAETRLHLLAMRDSALASLARHRRAGAAPRFFIPDSVSPPRRRVLEAAWDSVTRGLGPAASSMAAGMLVLLSDHSEATLYLLPQATGDGGCFVVVELGRWSRGGSTLSRTLRRALGPCGYFHAFGPPGPHVLAWLERTGLQPAAEADWDGTDGAVGFRRAAEPLDPEGRDLARIIETAWQRPYLGTLEQTACASGRLPACRDVLGAPEHQFFRLRRWPALEASGVFLRPGPLAPWWASEAGYFLADLVRAQGRERFARFWRSPLPVDSAFVTSFGVPLDSYISEWLRRDHAIRLGPSIRPSSVWLSLLFLVVIVGAGAVLTTRRQVG
jgi:hypothetical protein